jgi:flagellar biosynthesis chaperone FliJ
MKKEKELNNKILLNKHPYFFRHLYKDTNNKYKKHFTGYDLTCRQKFNKSLDDLIKQKRKNSEEREFLDQYYEFMPVIESDSVMNMLCKYIESIEFDLKQKFKECDDNYIFNLLTYEYEKDDDIYKKAKILVSEFMNEQSFLKRLGNELNKNNDFNFNLKNEIDFLFNNFKNELLKICPNIVELTNYIIEIFYLDKKSYNKDILWKSFGLEIFENVLENNKEKIMFPFPSESENGDIQYLNKGFSLGEVHNFGNL